MSFVNSLLLNTAGAPSKPGSEPSPAGQNGHLNQEFSQILRFLGQDQGTSGKNKPGGDASKDDMSNQYSIDPEMPIKSLLGFLEGFEGQLSKDSGAKSKEASSSLTTVPVENERRALYDFLSLLQEKLVQSSNPEVNNLVVPQDFDINNLDLDALVNLLEEFAVLLSQGSHASKLIIPSDEIKLLPLVSSGTGVLTDQSKVAAGDRMGLKINDRGEPVAINEFKVSDDQELKSQGAFAKGLLNALYQLETLFRKVKSAANNYDAKVASSNPDAKKVAKLLETLKGIDLNVRITTVDKSKETFDSTVGYLNNQILFQIKTILDKTKIGNGALSAIEPVEVGKMPIVKENVSKESRLLALPMRTSEVVFVSDIDVSRLPVSNLPKAFHQTTKPLDQLDVEGLTKGVPGKAVQVEDQNLKEQLIKSEVRTAEGLGYVLDTVRKAPVTETKRKPSQKIDETPDLTVKKTSINVSKGKIDTGNMAASKADEESNRNSTEKVFVRPTDPFALQSNELVNFQSAENAVAKLNYQLDLPPNKKVVATSNHQTNLKSGEKVATQSAEQINSGEIKPLVKSSENTVEDDKLTKISEADIEVKTSGSPVEKSIELAGVNITVDTELKLQTSGLYDEIGIQNAGFKEAELSSHTKLENSDSFLVAKNKMFSQEKTSPDTMVSKAASYNPEVKVPSKALSVLNETKSKFIAMAAEAADKSNKTNTDKAETNLISTQYKSVQDNFSKDKSYSGKEFTKMSEKATTMKKDVFDQPPQKASIEERFNIEQPKIKSLSIGKNDNLNAKSGIDFVALTTRAIVSQHAIATRKKLISNTAPLLSNVGASFENSPSQQLVSSSSSQNQTVQGSNMLEKWVDSHLDLSSRGWAANMAKTMVAALNRGQERLMFSLSPPSLGRISIAFATSRGALDVRIQAERKATITLLGDAEVKLTSNLESAGHRVNSLSYAEMNSGDTKFAFDHKERSNNGDKEKGKSDSSQVKKSVRLDADTASSTSPDKKIDDSLVNITV